MTGDPKKSETLEVRLSLQDKTALRDKAAKQGLTVSAAVRRLIADYLREPEPDVPTSPIRSLAMSCLAHPRKSLLGGAALLGSALVVAPLAHADPSRLAVVFEQTESVSETVDGRAEDGKRVRRTETELHVDGEAQACLALNRAAACDPDAPEETPGLALYFTVTDIGDASFVVRMDVREDGALVATPWLSVPKGEAGRIEIGGEDGSRVSISVAPLKS